MRRIILVTGLVAASCQPTAQVPGPVIDLARSVIVDLSHAYDEETIYWPTDEQGFVLEEVFEGITVGGYYYAANAIKTAEHGGTHLDAPIHFAEGMQTAEQIPLERLIGPVVVVDASSNAANDRDYLITPADVQAWESDHGEIPDGAIILFNTGYGRFWPDRDQYLGTTQTGPSAVPLLHFPGISPEASTWLVENRDIAAVGIDTPSIDYGQSTLFETHRILFAENIPAFENVANLDALPTTGAYVIALPMKIKGGSGGPLRIVALVPAS